ncbi:hypothetical protein [Aeoliella mucimassa]|uniref:Uncharacterized protein n=1 Tax=Aeoliella mucimassa TaxID=2527972 RepID=A0A518AT18_9BACT|nr:hypothetical protein [Aeoliella mucimassa]QDU57884.1 hypothetical protein Pan181_41070 [Aeoliella mucimassa]
MAISCQPELAYQVFKQRSTDPLVVHALLEKNWWPIAIKKPSDPEVAEPRNSFQISLGKNGHPR